MDKFYKSPTTFINCINVIIKTRAPFSNAHTHFIHILCTGFINCSPVLVTCTHVCMKTGVQLSNLHTRFNKDAWECFEQHSNWTMKDLTPTTSFSILSGIKLIVNLQWYLSNYSTQKHQRVLVRTGRKWRAEQAVDQAISQLKHQEIVGWLQPGKSGLGWGPAPKLWSKASKKERKELVVAEVSRMEEEKYKIRAVSQHQQGRWTNWEAVTNRAITWADMWRIPQARLSFLIRSTYDTLPSPRNLHLWYGSEANCHLCST